MSNDNAPPPDDRGEMSPPKKRAWAKPVVRPLYQIESVSTHPTLDPFRTGEQGLAYRGPTS